MSEQGQPPSSLDDLIAFARTRGGHCLSEAFLGLGAAHGWRCGRGHEFSASPRLLIEGGYWCPDCFPSVEDTRGWDYDEVARVDPLLARFHRSG